MGATRIEIAGRTFRAAGLDWDQPAHWDGAGPGELGLAAVTFDPGGISFVTRARWGVVLELLRAETVPLEARMPSGATWRCRARVRRALHGRPAWWWRLWCALGGRVRVELDMRLLPPVEVKSADGWQGVAW